MATATRRTRKSAASNGNGGRQTTAEIIAAADAVTVKPAAKRKPAKAKPAAKPAAVKREQDSITGTFQRGKCNAKTGRIEAHEPKGLAAASGSRTPRIAGSPRST